MSDSKNSASSIRTVVSKLFSGNPGEQLDALKTIVAHPDKAYEKALLRLNPTNLPVTNELWLLRAWLAIGGANLKPTILAKIQSQNPVIRSFAVKILASIGLKQKDEESFHLILHHLSDPNNKVVRTCINALKENLSKRQVGIIIDHYFDVNNKQKCLNCLFLINQLKLTDKITILETCLNHSSKKVRGFALKILPTFETEHPEIRKLLLRNRPNKTSEYSLSNEHSALLSAATELFSSDEVDSKVDFLMELRTNPEWLKDGQLQGFIKTQLKTQSDPFVIATLVKNYVLYKPDDGWAELSPFLQHADKRVVSNTIEALVSLKETNVIGFLETFISSSDLSQKASRRILSAGLPLLIQHAPEQAFQAMEALAQVGSTGVSTFLFHLAKWEKPPVALNALVIQLIQNEIRLDLLQPLANHLIQNGTIDDYVKIHIMLSMVKEGDKSKLLQRLDEQMSKNFDAESIQKALEMVDPKDIKVASNLTDQVANQLEIILPPELEPENNFSIAILALTLVFFIGFLIWSANLLLGSSQPEPRENPETEIVTEKSIESPDVSNAATSKTTITTSASITQITTQPKSVTVTDIKTIPKFKIPKAVFPRSSKSTTISTPATSPTKPATPPVVIPKYMRPNAPSLVVEEIPADDYEQIIFTTIDNEDVEIEFLSPVLEKMKTFEVTAETMALIIENGVVVYSLASKEKKSEVLEFDKEYKDKLYPHIKVVIEYTIKDSKIEVFKMDVLPGEYRF
jgi:cytoskeletal protein RodZ